MSKSALGRTLQKVELDSPSPFRSSMERFKCNRSPQFSKPFRVLLYAILGRQVFCARRACSEGCDARKETPFARDKNGHQLPTTYGGVQRTPHTRKNSTFPNGPIVNLGRSARRDGASIVQKKDDRPNPILRLVAWLPCCLPETPFPAPQTEFGFVDEKKDDGTKPIWRGRFEMRCSRRKQRRRWDSNPRNNGFAIRPLRPLGYAAGFLRPTSAGIRPHQASLVCITGRRKEGNEVMATKAEAITGIAATRQK